MRFSRRSIVWVIFLVAMVAIVFTLFSPWQQGDEVRSVTHLRNDVAAGNVASIAQQVEEVTVVTKGETTYKVNIGQNTIEILRRSLEEVRDENLENASHKDKQELIARLGIVVYPSEDHKTVRITSKLPVLRDKYSPQIMNIASPKL